MRRVAAHADARAANPLESVLRAISLRVGGLRFEPQVRIDSADDGRFLARADLADRHLRIVAEADGFEFHGERELFERDLKRQDDLVIDDWLVLRYGWDHVMTRDAWVESTLNRAVLLRQRLGYGRPLL